MRAVIFDGSTVRVDRNRPEPRPSSGEALIRVLRASISGTDLAICNGRLAFKGVLGHEFVGVVEHVEPPNPNGTLTGKRVVGQIISACGNCDMCQGGLSRHCRQRTILGMLGRDGCLCERFAWHAANLIEVPDTIDDDHAVFVQPLAAALQVAQQLTIVGKPYITVLGDGALGLLTVQVMSRLNASVRLVGWQAARLAVCEKWGIKHRSIDDVGRRADQDVVVDCTGTAEGLALAMQLVRPRGKVVLKGFGEGGIHSAAASNTYDHLALVLNEVELIGSHTGPMNEALALIARREIDVVSLISRRMKLDDGPALFKAAQAPGMIKVLVDP